MFQTKKIKLKKVCKFCSTVYFRNEKYSDKQWFESKFCSSHCSAESKRKYAQKKDKYTAYDRKQGLLPQGSPESREKISRLTRLAMQRPEVQEKIRQPRNYTYSEDRKIAQSNNLKGKMPANLLYANSCYPNIQRGNYDINGTEMYFRSKWEANYALYLDFLVDHKQIIKWEYESDVFIFEQIKYGTRSYRPDFKLFNLNGSIEYHEIKGYMDSKSRTKLKRMAKYYPEIKLILVQRDEYMHLIKQLGKLLKFY